MPGNSPPRTCSSTSRAIVPPRSYATRIDCLLGRREFCHSSIIHREGRTTVRIAILEDDPDQLAVLRRWLDEDGHDVHAYLSGSEMRKNGAKVELTPKEFELTVTLFRNIWRLMSRGHLQETVWGRSGDLATRTVDTHVSQVRKKLDLRPESGYRAVPIYNYGYRL